MSKDKATAAEHSAEQHAEEHADRQDHDRAPTTSEDAEAIELSEQAADLVRALEEERDQAIESRKRALADFQNYQRRAIDNERRALQEGAIRAVRAILPVLDHFDLALNQSSSSMSVEQLVGGVKIVRDELMKALQTSGVERIDPQPGESFDPNRHDAMMRQPARDVEPGHIVSALQPGYVMADHVLRPAKVIIAAEPDESGEPPSEE